jgi:hypothetical protein
MSSCCSTHKDIISNYDIIDRLIRYEEPGQNIIFINLKKSLLVINVTDYVKTCPHCGNHRKIYIYGTWPDVRASFDGVTDLPIRAIIHDVDTSGINVVVRDEPSFGKFIYAFSFYLGCCFIIYYPTGNIGLSDFKNCQNICVDGKPAICCQTTDKKKFMLINSDGKIIDVEVVYPTELGNDRFKIGNGIMRYDSNKSIWKYTANPALNTKPAAARE